MSTKGKAVTHAIDTKVPGEHGGGKENNVWAVVDGKKVLRVTCPRTHGSSDVKTGTLQSIRKQLHLTREQFDEFIECTLTGPQYVALLRAKVAEGRL